MPFPFSALIYPTATLLMLWKLSGTGPIAKYRKAGAFSPDTARKPSSLGIMFPDLLAGSVRRGLLKPTGDGRYYIDPARDARNRRRWRIAQIVTPVIVILLALGWWWMGRAY